MFLILCGMSLRRWGIGRDGFSALFDEDGKQLTDFVKGSFKWKWSEANYKRIIFNQEAGIELPPR